MNKKYTVVSTVLLVAAAVALSGCGKKTTTTTTNTNTVPVVVTEAPFTMESGKKVFSLQLVNGLLNYKTMTFTPGDTVEIRLTSDNQPADFKFLEVPAVSTNGIFGTILNTNDPGGTYKLVCVDRECGTITITVLPGTNVNTNASAVTNQPANTNSTSQITKAETQRIPAGTTLTPGMNMVTTTTFTVGDQLALNITGTFNSGDMLTHAITSSTGTTVIAQGPSSTLMTGSNGSCCSALPSVAGSYNVDLYVNGTKAQSVPITVTSK